MFDIHGCWSHSKLHNPIAPAICDASNHFKPPFGIFRRVGCEILLGCSAPRPVARHFSSGIGANNEAKATTHPHVRNEVPCGNNFAILPSAIVLPRSPYRDLFPIRMYAPLSHFSILSPPFLFLRSFISRCYLYHIRFQFVSCLSPVSFVSHSLSISYLFPV